jgi:hypothetical protein
MLENLQGFMHPVYSNVVNIQTNNYHIFPVIQQLAPRNPIPAFIMITILFIIWIIYVYKYLKPQIDSEEKNINII